MLLAINSGNSGILQLLLLNGSLDYNTSIRETALEWTIDRESRIYFENYLTRAWTLQHKTGREHLGWLWTITAWTLCCFWWTKVRTSKHPMVKKP